MDGQWNQQFPAMPDGCDSNASVATVAGGAGLAVVYLTDNGLVGGNALFKSIKFIHANYTQNDPNLGRSISVSGDLKTLTITCVKQLFTGIVLLSTNILGSVAILPAADGTTLNILVQGNKV